MKIERINPSDVEKFKELRQIFIEVFENPAPDLDDRQYEILRDNRHFIALGAVVGFQLVGGLTAHIVPNYYRGGHDLYINDLAVLKDHQGKRIGQSLLEAAQDFCSKHGIGEMYVSADAKDKKANSFYEKNRGKKKGTNFYTFSIRPEA